ncbi:hypothetical protein M8745_19905, partial [Lutimaribacter sp. EGI FJ00014]|nr:hypothetical protein [Lutimaribacter sp. EGI FJ00014]
GWVYGGQMVYVVPGRALTVVMISNENGPAGRSGHRDDLHALLKRIIEVTDGVRKEALTE